MTRHDLRSIELNPYEVPCSTRAARRRGPGYAFKRFIVALLAFFLAFWAGAIAIFVCVWLQENGLF